MESFPINLEPFLGYWTLFGQQRDRELNPIQLKIIATHSALRLYGLIPDYATNGSVALSVMNSQGISEQEIQSANGYIATTIAPSISFYGEFKNRWDSVNSVYTITEYENLPFFLVNVDTTFGDVNPGMIKSIMDYEVKAALDRGEDVPEYFIRPKLEG